MKQLLTFMLILLGASCFTWFVIDVDAVCNQPKQVPKKDTAKREIHWETDTPSVRIVGMRTDSISVNGWKLQSSGLTGDLSGYGYRYAISDKPVDSLINLIDSLRRKISFIEQHGWVRTKIIHDTVDAIQLWILPGFQDRIQLIDSLLRRDSTFKSNL
jgi:hypothetical protein